jgi:holin-like protein
MVLGFACLLVCQLLGEALAHGLGLPIPGPVLGMALLVLGFGGLRRLSGSAAAGTEAVADGLLGNLGLLFVPAGVGVIQYGGLLATYGVAIGLSVLVSTLAALLATVGTFLAVKRLLGRTAESAP